MLILYDLCCTGSWASLITAQFRSQNWRGKPVLPAISSPTFYTASTSPCLFHVILVLCKGTCGFKIPSISCHNLTVYTDNTVHFIFNNASQIWIPAYLESLHLLFTLPTCPAFCSKQKGKLITNRGYFRSKFGTLAVHSKNSYLGGLDQSQN